MQRTNRLAALLLAPGLVLICASFVVPIVRILVMAVADPELAEAMPRTTAMLRSWDGQGLPPELALVAIGEELAAALQERRIGRIAQRLNFDRTGMRSLMLRTARARTVSRDSLVAVDHRWAETETWRLLRSATGT